MKEGMYSFASLFAADGAAGFLGCAPAGGIVPVLPRRISVWMLGVVFSGREEGNAKAQG